MSKQAEIEFTMGADPEFMVAYGPRKPVYSGGYDNVEFNKFGGFGPDGSERPFELRPNPHVDPIEVVRNLRGIMKTIVKDYPELSEAKWLAGSHVAGDAIGGHIHFGISNFWRAKSLDMVTDAGYNGCVDLCRKMTKVLDIFLAPSAVLLEEPVQARRRRRTGYGCLGDFRSTSYGFEYRVASSWLTSPHVAAAVLSLGKVVVDEYIHNPSLDESSNFTKKEENRRKRAVRTCNRNDLKEFHHSAWTKIQGMRLYPKYRSYIDLLGYLVKKDLTWNPDTTIREAWGIVNPAIGEDDALTRKWLSLKTLWNIN